MLIKIGAFGCTEVWDGILQSPLKLSPNHGLDGFLPIKIKDELILSEWVNAIIIPAIHKPTLQAAIPAVLKGKVLYVENDCKDIWDWSEKVYGIIKETHGDIGSAFIINRNSEEC
ncbi:MAG: hypothetical protein J1F60_01885 [Oscillospiraceae bacterium]|nr:hypothetical protein [Oscillospiraceae bacterium]